MTSKAAVADDCGKAVLRNDWNSEMRKMSRRVQTHLYRHRKSEMCKNDGYYENE